MDSTTVDLGSRLRVKPIYPRYKLDETHFVVGDQRGLTLDFTDPHGQAWALMDLLDGALTVGEAVCALRTRFPQLTTADALAGVRRFEQLRLLEDSTASRYDLDTPYCRYVGNVNYFSHFARASTVRGRVQDTLCDSTVTLLGLGGGGSTILELLSGIGIGTVRAFDYDRVEATNLNRQMLFREGDIGCTKVDAARRSIEARNSLQQHQFANRWIDSPETVHDCIAGSGLVISAIDEPHGQILRIVNRACVELNIPCVYGGSQTTRGRVFSVLPFMSGCIDCMFRHYDSMDPQWARASREFLRLGIEAPTLAYVPAIMHVCSLVADEAVRILTGYLPPRSVATQLEVDFETGGVDPFLSWDRDEVGCPTCGTGDEETFAAHIGMCPLHETART